MVEHCDGRLRELFLGPKKCPPKAADFSLGSQLLGLGPFDQLEMRLAETLFQK